MSLSAVQPPPASTAVPDPVAAERRQRILESLAAVIAEDGYGRSRVADVARRARVSLRTFYDEFTNKEMAFLELHRTLVEHVATTLETAVVFEGDWRGEMRGGFETYFRLLLFRPNLTTAVMLELTTISAEGYAAREFARERYAGLLIELVERGREAYPEIPSRALTPLMARSVLGAVLELVTSGVDESDPLPDLVDTATDLLWSIVTNP